MSTATIDKIFQQSDKERLEELVLLFMESICREEKPDKLIVLSSWINAKCPDKMRFIFDSKGIPSVVYTRHARILIPNPSYLFDTGLLTCYSLSELLMTRLPLSGVMKVESVEDLEGLLRAETLSKFAPAALRTGADLNTSEE